MKTSNKIIESEKQVNENAENSEKIPDADKKLAEAKAKKSERTENIVALAVFLFLILIGAFIFTQGFGLLNKSNAQTTKMKMTIINDPMQGNDNASVVIVAFSDYECPFCKKAESTIKDVLKKYDGKVLYVFKDNPLTFLHAYAFNASLAAECAKEQDKYWEYHDYLFEHQDQLDVPHLEQYAKDLGLNTENFNICLETQRHKDDVNQDMTAGEEAGVSGTPTFFIFNGNLRTIAVKATDAAVIVGAQPESDFDKVIDGFLKSKI